MERLNVSWEGTCRVKKHLENSVGITPVTRPVAS